MDHFSPQPELPLPATPPSSTITINGRCTLRREGVLRVVMVAGLAMHHWMEGDWAAEANAMVSLVLCGYADQNEVARAFGCSTRTLRRCQRRYEHGGLAALGRSPWRPKGSCAAPSPWVSAAHALQGSGIGIRDIAQRFKVGKTSVSKWLRRVGGAEGASVQAETAAKPLCETSASNENWSMDPDPSNRVFDRIFARLGLLMDAEPVFIPGERVPRVGVLLAIPALVQSGILEVAEEVYGHIGPAFYGLRTTMLALLLLALLRIKKPEVLKEHCPSDLGRMLGLDRAPEVKTLRRKLTRLAAYGRAGIFGHKLAQRRVARRGRTLGFLHMDGHVRVYHGSHRLPKAHVTRMRLSLPATTDYWVNDKHGDPLFVVTAEFNEGLVTMLSELAAEIRSLVGPRRRITMVFDRGGWSPKLFAKLIKARFDILTYRKGRSEIIPAKQFTRCVKRIEGRNVSYDLNDRNIRLLKGRLRLRQITRLSGDGHQMRIPAMPRQASGRCPASVPVVTPPVAERSDAGLLVL